MFDSNPLKKQGGKEVSRLKREIENLYDRFFNRDLPSAKEFFKEDSWLPRVDLVESKKEIEVRAELAGMEANEIDVGLDGKVLRIKGEKRQEKEDRDKNYCLIERHYGSFNRTVELPTEVDEEKVEASFKKGVLKIVLKKLKATETKKIEIKTS